MASVKEKVEALVEPIINALGVELVEVCYEKKHDGMNLTVYIDRKGGIDLETCERVHRAIDEPLDELDPTNGASYTLNVSSAGLDREIKTDKDFARNISEVLQIKLYQKVDGLKEVIGTLKCFDEKDIKVETLKGKEITLPRKLISKATKYIKF